jgi:hypothetical protein
LGEDKGGARRSGARRENRLRRAASLVGVAGFEPAPSGDETSMAASIAEMAGGVLGLAGFGAVLDPSFATQPTVHDANGDEKDAKHV